MCVYKNFTDKILANRTLRRIINDSISIELCVLCAVYYVASIHTIHFCAQPLLCAACQLLFLTAGRRKTKNDGGDCNDADDKFIVDALRKC